MTATLEPTPKAGVAASTRRRRRILGIGIIAAITLLQVASLAMAGHDRGRVLFQVVLLAIGLPVHMTVFSVGFAWASKKRLAASTTVISGIVVAGLLGLGLGLAMWLLTHHISALKPPSATAWRLFRALLFGFMSGQVNLGLWALAFVFPFAVEDARIRSLESDKLRLETEKLRTAAELARLRAHLEPHFLLNTLNAIAGLVTDDPREARRLLACLGDLLRDALRDEAEMQTLEEQIQWLRRYAQILEARHPGHLAFRWDIAPTASSVMLPRLLLQPLVENAVKHGALRRASGGEVTVRAEVVGENGSSSLSCTIEDNGPGMRSEETRSGAFGLHAVRRRLELKYPERASLRLESSGDGTRSIVLLPLQGRLT